MTFFLIPDSRCSQRSQLFTLVTRLWLTPAQCTRQTRTVTADRQSQSAVAIGSRTGVCAAYGVKVGMFSLRTLKWGALTIFVAQNAGVVLLMKLSRRTPGTPYSTRVAVLMQEVVKLAICTLLYAHETGGPIAAIAAIRADFRDNATEWLQLGIPAFLYTLQANPSPSAETAHSPEPGRSSAITLSPARSGPPADTRARAKA
jgi:hypothetical protein